MVPTCFGLEVGKARRWCDWERRYSWFVGYGKFLSDIPRPTCDFAGVCLARGVGIVGTASTCQYVVNSSDSRFLYNR